MHTAHDEGGGLASTGTSNEGLMVVAHEAKEVGAAALAPAQIGSVIDETGKVRVLEVDAQREHMATPAVVLDDAAGEIGPASGIRRRHRPSQSPAAPRCARAGSNNRAHRKR